MLINNFNTGVTFEFKNGLTISIQWGIGNYCNNRSFGYIGQNEPRENYSSPNAEIAIWDGNNTWFDFGENMVKGWVDTDEVADWIAAVKNATSLNDIQKPS